MGGSAEEKRKRREGCGRRGGIPGAVGGGSAAAWRGADTRGAGGWTPAAGWGCVRVPQVFTHGPRHQVGATEPGRALPLQPLMPRVGQPPAMLCYMPGVAFVPALLVSWSSAAFIISYVIAVLAGHVEPLVPYIR